MKILIQTVQGENGELFAITRGRRVLLAQVAPAIEVYEHRQSVPLLGARSRGVKTHTEAMLRCAQPEPTREVDAAFLQGVERIEFFGEFQRADGVFERVRFDALDIEEMDLTGGDWVFCVRGQGAEIAIRIGL